MAVALIPAAAFSSCLDEIIINNHGFTTSVENLVQVRFTSFFKITLILQKLTYLQEEMFGLQYIHTIYTGSIYTYVLLEISVHLSLFLCAFVDT